MAQERRGRGRRMGQRKLMTQKLAKGRAVYKRNKYIMGEHERRHNLSLEYCTAPDWTCGMGGLEDLESDGRVN